MKKIKITKNPDKQKFIRIWDNFVKLPKNTKLNLICMSNYKIFIKKVK